MLHIVKVYVAVIFLLLCIVDGASLSAQKSSQCSQDLKFLTVPNVALINDGNGMTPLTKLFSQDGVDYYSAIPAQAPVYWEWIFRNGIRIVAVYQDQNARETEIQYLSEPNRVASVTAPAYHLWLNMVKFEVIHLRPTTQYDEPLNDKWSILQESFFAPRSCISVPPNISYFSAIAWSRYGLHAGDGDPNWITDANADPRHPPQSISDPILTRAVRITVAQIESIERSSTH